MKRRSALGDGRWRVGALPNRVSDPQWSASATVRRVKICSMPQPLLIVDGDNLAHRAYHSTPKSVVGVNGQPINAIVGFASMLHNVWQKELPRGIFVAWVTL